ncbi:MAG: nucleotidyltransferase domain-containing protein [Methylococcales bacterium]
MPDRFSIRRSMALPEKERLVLELTRELNWLPELVFVFLHGSFLVESTFRDLDLAVYVRPESGNDLRFRDYEADLAVDLTLKAGIPVDIRVLNDAPVGFRYHALKGRLLMVRDENMLDEFRARTWDEYCDFAPFAREFLRGVLRG